MKRGECSKFIYRERFIYKFLDWIIRKYFGECPAHHQIQYNLCDHDISFRGLLKKFNVAFANLEKWPL